MKLSNPAQQSLATQPNLEKDGIFLPKIMREAIKSHSETKLKKARMSRFLSQTQLAELLHIRPCAVSALERAGIQRVSTAKKYAAVLGCRPEDLLEL